MSTNSERYLKINEKRMMVDYTIAFSPYLWYKNIQYLKVLKSKTNFFYRKMETHIA